MLEYTTMAALQEENTSMITEVFQMAMDLEKYKNRLNVRMQSWNTFLFFLCTQFCEFIITQVKTPSFGKQKITISKQTQ